MIHKFCKTRLRREGIIKIRKKTLPKMDSTRLHVHVQMQLEIYQTKCISMKYTNLF